MFHFFYARPLLLAMILLIGSLLGLIGYLNMPRNMYPDVERPQVKVITTLPGAAAQTVAHKVSRPIEQELYTLAGIRNVQSINKNEVSIVAVTRCPGYAANYPPKPRPPASMRQARSSTRC